MTSLILIRIFWMWVGLTLWASVRSIMILPPTQIRPSLESIPRVNNRNYFLKCRHSHQYQVCDTTDNTKMIQMRSSYDDMRPSKKWILFFNKTSKLWWELCFTAKYKVWFSYFEALKPLRTAYGGLLHDTRIRKAERRSGHEVVTDQDNQNNNTLTRMIITH